MKRGLEQLLAQIDQATPAPRPMTDIAESAHTIARRRQDLRRIGGTVVLALIVGGIGYRVTRPSIVTVATPINVAATMPAKAIAKDEAASFKQEIARLQAEAEFHSRLAEQLWQVELEHQPPAQPHHRVRWEALAPHPDDAAFALVYQADRLRAMPDQATAAAELYRQVADDFPNSPSATVARQRLALLDNRKDG